MRGRWSKANRCTKEKKLNSRNCAATWTDRAPEDCREPGTPRPKPSGYADFSLKTMMAAVQVAL